MDKQETRQLAEIKNKRFEIVSRTYLNEFSKCVIIILDNKTGKMKKEVFELK